VEGGDQIWKVDTPEEKDNSTLGTSEGWNSKVDRQNWLVSEHKQLI